ncbi:MAG: dynamin family protein [Clostridium sp.]
MREVFIKYNPYKLETIITIDNKILKNNSRLNVGSKSLQEWVEKLPQILKEEYATNNFKIIFHGSTNDYEDILAVATKAKKRNIQIECKHIPAKESKDRLKNINDIFEEIKNGPFEELRSEKIINLFEDASEREFPVTVVATMSSGKSTLINSLLGKDLMPSSNLACTAKVTQIKDCKIDKYIAETFDSEGNIIKTYEDISQNVMNKINNIKEIDRVKVIGDIPFIKSDEIALTLLDTPGTDNSMDASHKEITYRLVSKSSDALILYVINACGLAKDDDKRLLTYVAETLDKGSLALRDRFIFVLNMMDRLKPNEVQVTIDKAREYLEQNGIKNPNIFPVSSLAALNTRNLLKGISIDDADDINDDIYELKGMIRKLSNNKELHLETYSPLPLSVKKEIENKLNQAISQGDKKEEALIHSGIVSLEKAIQLYLDKYIVTSKVKNISDAFNKSIQSLKYIEDIKRKVNENRDQSEELSKQIKSIQSKISNIDRAKLLKQEVNYVGYSGKVYEKCTEIREKGQKEVRLLLEKFTDRMTEEEAKQAAENFYKEIGDLQAKLKVEIEEVVVSSIKRNAQDRFEEYQRSIKSLVDELSEFNIEISPFKLMEGDINAIKNSCSLEEYTICENIKVGFKRKLNPNFKIYNFKSLLKPLIKVDVLKAVTKIKGREFANTNMAEIQANLHKNCEAAKKYINEQIKVTEKETNRMFGELDDIYKTKSSEIEEYIENLGYINKSVEESEKDLQWITNIQTKVDSILDI